MGDGTPRCREGRRGGTVLKKKQSLRFQCYSWVRGQPWYTSSKFSSLHSTDFVAVATKQESHFLFLDIKGRATQQSYWVTINIYSLLSLSVPTGWGQLQHFVSITWVHYAARAMVYVTLWHKTLLCSFVSVLPHIPVGLWVAAETIL